MSNLPDFARRDRDEVFTLMHDLLTNPHQSPPRSHLKELVMHDDGHFRVLFDPAFFILPEGETSPSKSQWNTLKKRIKRHQPTIFVFKEYGTSGKHVYLDFGFFAHNER